MRKSIWNQFSRILHKHQNGILHWYCIDNNGMSSNWTSIIFNNMKCHNLRKIKLHISPESLIAVMETCTWVRFCSQRNFWTNIHPKYPVCDLPNIFYIIFHAKRICACIVLLRLCRKTKTKQTRSLIQLQYLLSFRWPNLSKLVLRDKNAEGGAPGPSERRKFWEFSLRHPHVTEFKSTIPNIISDNFEAFLKLKTIECGSIRDIQTLCKPLVDGEFLPKFRGNFILVLTCGR